MYKKKNVEPEGEKTSFLLHFDNNINDAKGKYSFWGYGSYSYSSGKFSNCLSAVSGGIKGNLNGLQYNDFTIDWWDKVSSDTIGSAIEINGSILLNHRGNHYILLYPDVDWTIATSVGMNNGQWHHRAIVKKGSIVYIFQDGILLSSFTHNKNPYPFDAIGIGKRVNGSIQDVFNGMIDEVRFSNVARWTSNFTPPSSPYTAD